MLSKSMTIQDKECNNKLFAKGKPKRKLTAASCLPMFPIVTPPEKNMHGNHDLTNIKSALEYLKLRKNIVFDECYENIV